MQLSTSLEKLRRTKQAQEQQLQKLKEKYEADCIKINGYIAQQNMLMGKELDKVIPSSVTN
jgi:Ca2+-binding EF-hand superfamily protein